MGLRQTVVRAPLATSLNVRALRRTELAALYALRMREARPGVVGANVEYLCRDALDPFAHQLVVQGEDRALLGAARILAPAAAMAAGGGFAEAMFDLGAARDGAPMLEVSWPVVAFGACRRPVAALLVESARRQAARLKLNEILFCVGITRQELATLTNAVTAPVWVPALQRMRPWMRVPHAALHHAQTHAELPSLLVCLLAAGARIGGEAAWDPGLQRAVVPLHLDVRGGRS